MMDPPDITESIAAEGDDGGEINTSWDTKSGAGESWEVGQDGFGGSKQYNGGVRFVTVALDNTDTIDSADLKIQVNALTGASGGADSGNIYGDYVDDAAAWSSSSRPTQVTKTTASTAFGTAFTSTGAKTFDVTGIIAEIIARAGWVSGNALRLGLLETSTTYYRSACDDYGETSPATLEIYYTGSASGRIMSSLAHHGGLAGAGGIAGQGGGLAG